jgi:pentatricopeptide repeat protein
VPDKITYNAAISACEKGGQWQQALNLLSLMPEAKVVPNEITYNAAISACEKGGQWQLALNLLSLMPEAKAVPNKITYSAAISACEKGGQWQLALNLLSLMPDAKVVPNEITYNAAISASAKGGLWEFALVLLGVMAQHNVMRDQITYNAVLDAAFDKHQGCALFDEARSLVMYPRLLQKGESFLELHDLSCGAAVHAVRWWLAEVVPRLLVAGTERPARFTIITGWGKSRKEWQTSDIQATVIQLLDELQLQSCIDVTNQGCVIIDAQQLESSALRPL